MENLVFIKFIHGDFDQGFKVILRIGSDTEIEGIFPPAPDIPALYQQWQSHYLTLASCWRDRFGTRRAMNSTETRQQCYQSSEALRKNIRAWLTSENREFYTLREKLLKGIRKSQEGVRVVIQAELPLLRQLPWHEWDIFSDHTKVEIALSPLRYDKIERATPIIHKNQVRILAILGNSIGINVESDRQFLENLPDADTVFLSEPSRKELTDHLWEQGWDILFFAGHSSSQGETGRIYINKTESLTIGELKYGLKKAIERGLRIAIFNSCDGLGLARELEALNIPQVIVMRELVPDNFAQEFLKYSLKSYANGEPLYLAVRAARERLHDQGLEDEYPGVTWLPIICQNPSEACLTWQELVLGDRQVEKTNNTNQPINTKELTMNVNKIIARLKDTSVLDFLETNRQNSPLEMELLNTIREQLEKAEMLGLLTRFQKQPSPPSKLELQKELEKQINEDPVFAKKLFDLFKQLETAGIIPKISENKKKPNIIINAGGSKGIVIGDNGSVTNKW